MVATPGLRAAHVGVMGYAETIETITAAHAEKLRAQPQTRNRFYGGYETFESRLISAAVDEWENGDHDRNGSANTGAGVMLAPAAAELAGRLLDYDSPNESYILPIAAPESVTTKTKTVKVAVPGELVEKLRANNPWQAKSRLRELLHQEYPKTVLGAVEIVSMPAARKPQAKATEGTAVTRYKIVAAEKFYTGDESIHAAFLALHVTQAEARAAAIALLSEHDSLPDLGVEAVVGRIAEDGTFSKTLVTIARPVAEEAVITLKVTTHTVAAKPKIDSYQVMFWYHH